MQINRIFRFSDRASLQYVNFRLKFSKAMSRTYESGLDVACGDFHNSFLFRTKTYIGVDIVSPSKNLPKFQQSRFFLMDAIRDKLPKADIVMCLETIGFNELFQHEQSVLMTSKLANSTNSGGTLIMNVGPKAHADRHAEIMRVLQGSFGKVIQVDYGRWSGNKGPFFAILGALLFLLIPSMAPPPEVKQKSTLYICENRGETQAAV